MYFETPDDYYDLFETCFNKTSLRYCYCFDEINGKYLKVLSSDLTYIKETNKITSKIKSLNFEYDLSKCIIVLNNKINYSRELKEEVKLYSMEIEINRAKIGVNFFTELDALLQKAKGFNISPAFVSVFPYYTRSLGNTHEIFVTTENQGMLPMIETLFYMND